MRSKVTSRGQTAVPVKLRCKFGIAEGGSIQWHDLGRAALVTPVPADPVASFRGKSIKKNLTRNLLIQRGEDRKKEK